MAKVYTDKDADLGVFKGKTLAVLGFGSQGHAHALNLKESGCKVIIGLYEGSKSIAVAKEKGFEVFTTGEAVKRADVIMVAIPDTKQPSAYEKDIAPNLTKGKTLLFSHGFSIHYKTIVPPGAYDITFSPPYSAPLGAVTYSNIVVSQDTTLDGALPAVPFFTTVGVGIAGLGNITPVISASGGTPRLGNAAYGLEFSQTRGGANGVLIYSIGSASNPLPSPMQIAPPMLRRYVSLGGAPGVAGGGSGSFALPIANDPAFAGHLLRAWLVVRDGAVAGGLSSTNELRATIAP